MEKVSATFSVLMIPFDAWDVENTWLISLIWISGCRQMKATWVSNVRGHRKHSHLRTSETLP